MVSDLSRLAEKMSARAKERENGRNVSAALRPRSYPLPLFLSLWLPVILWAAFIFYLSSIPHLRFLQSHWDFLFRKIGHLGVYGILARLVARALSGSTLWSWKKIFAGSLVLTILYACTDEFHQSFVPGRSATVHDVVIDSVGGWLALGVVP